VLRGSFLLTAASIGGPVVDRPRLLGPVRVAEHQ
jgi:hypothetical protein